MLRGTVAFLLLVAFALVGSEVRAALARRGRSAPAMEGLSFLVVGFALGGRGAGLLPPDVLQALRPLVLLGLAWIGLAFGVDLELRVVRRLHPLHRAVGLAVPLGVGLVVACAGWLVGLEVALALGVAAIAMVPSASTLEGLARGRPVHDRNALALLKLVAAFAGMPAVALLVVASSLASPAAAGGAGVPFWKLTVAAVGAGISFGYVLVVLMRGVRDPIELLGLVTGTVAGTAGVSALLGVSGLPPGAMVGAIAVNRCIFPHRLLRVVRWLERPMLIALLVLVGASWAGGSFSWPVFVLLAAVRPLALLAVVRMLATRAGALGVPVRPSWLGAGLLPQGELALGILVALLGTAIDTSGVLEAAVTAIVATQIVGQLWLRRRLFGAGGGHDR